MFFYVDESGHTGKNLFDHNQPVLYYGVLSSSENLDLLAKEEIRQVRKKVGAERLHASELGIGGLVQVSSHLKLIQEKYQLNFDLVTIKKADHAVISFFDQVFDQGNNPAMLWSGYWTPLRYILLITVAHLFNEDLARQAWEARIDTNDESAEAKLVLVCRELISRLPQIADPRSKQIIGDALNWASQNPSNLCYNCKRKKDVLSITPNIIGFQVVMQDIASRLNSPKSKAEITVDQQCQFNKPQKELAEFYATTRDLDWSLGGGLPSMDLSKIPTAPISFKSSKESPGLELVDCYLWVFRRLFDGKEVPAQLLAIIEPHFHKMQYDEVSLAAIDERWANHFVNPSHATEDQKNKGLELMAMEEERRLRAIALLEPLNS